MLERCSLLRVVEALRFIFPPNIPYIGQTHVEQRMGIPQAHHSLKRCCASVLTFLACHRRPYEGMDLRMRRTFRGVLLAAWAFCSSLGQEFLPPPSGHFGICSAGSWIAFTKIHDIKGNSLLCSLLDTVLVPYERIYNLKLDFEDPSPSTHASFTFQIGAVFGGYDLQVKQLHPVLIQAKDDVILSTIPRLDPMNGWNLAHLFAGGFSGWLQASNVFNRSMDQIFIDPQVTVELDTRIAFACSASFRHELFAAPLGPGFLPPPSGRFGICGTGSWIAFAKIYDIKGNWLRCFLLGAVLVPYERTYDFKLVVDILSSAAHPSFTSQSDFRVWRTVGFFGYVPSLSSSLGLSGLPIGSSLSGRSIRGLSRGDLLLSPLSFLGFAPFGAVGWGLVSPLILAPFRNSQRASWDAPSVLMGLRDRPPRFLDLFTRVSAQKGWHRALTVRAWV